MLLRAISQPVGASRQSIKSKQERGYAMRFQGPALVALLISLLLPASAAVAGPLDPKVVPGLVLSAGQVHTRRDDDGAGTGYFLDANYARVFLNAGASFKSFENDKIQNVYVGTGITGFLQLQIGFGTEGVVKRLRHDFNMARAYEFFSGKPRNRYNQSLGTRFTVTLALEEYSDDERFNNLHAGIGLLY